MYRRLWIPAAEKDFESLEQFIKADEHLKRILNDPYGCSQQVVGWNGVRKIRVERFRLFIHIDDTTQTITALAFLDRKKCYKMKEQVMKRRR